MDKKKVTPESFDAYRNWQRHILASKPKLSEGIRRVTLIAYCFAQASHGANGLGCFASDDTIAGELGMYDRKAVRPYRLEAMRLGWFAWNGERKGRAKVLDIAIPADIPAEDESPLVSADGHVSGAYEADCPACQEHLRKLDRGEVDGYVPTWQIHEEATSRLGG